MIKGMFKIIPILMGVVISYIAALIMNACGVTVMGADGTAQPLMDFTAVAQAGLVGLPPFQLAKFDVTAILVMAPIALATMMEHIGDMSAISATTEATSVQTAANSLLGMNPVAIFCSNEGAVTGFLAAVSDGEDLAEGGKYAGLVVAGFDAGAAQKNAVRQGWFYGSVTQDPYQIGYQAVALAVAAANGEAVEDVDTGAQWYDASNIDGAAVRQREDEPSPVRDLRRLHASRDQSADRYRDCIRNLYPHIRTSLCRRAVVPRKRCFVAVRI